MTQSTIKNAIAIMPEPRTFWLYITKTGILGDFCCPAGFEIRWKQISDFDDRVWEEIHVQEVLEHVQEVLEDED